MSVCTCVYVYAYVYVHACVCAYVCVFMHVCMYMHKCVCMCIYVCACVCMQVHACMCVCILFKHQGWGWRDGSVRSACCPSVRTHVWSLSSHVKDRQGGVPLHPAAGEAETGGSLELLSQLL